MSSPRTLSSFRCPLITGASSGLGLEYARQLAPHVSTLILVARRDELLTKIAQDLTQQHPHLKVKTLPCDLSTTDGRNHLINALSEGELYPDLLLNNAGMGDYGEFSTSDWTKIEQMMTLNMQALTHLTHALLPGLTAQSGAVLNVSSLASVLPIPDFAVYAATKAYVTSFSEALRLELRDHKVSVLAVCPGPVKTGFGNIALRGKASELPVKEAFYVTAEQVVTDSLKALLKDRARIYPGLKVAITGTALSLLPICAIRLIMSTRPRQSE